MASRKPCTVLLSLLLSTSLFLSSTSLHVLVCPRNCAESCPDKQSEVQLGSASFVNFTCDVDGTNARFSYKPDKKVLHLFDKVAVQKKVIDGFINIEQLYIENLNLTNDDLKVDLLESRNKLTIISFSGNKLLTQIPHEIFARKDFLWAVVLNDNNLTTLPLSQIKHPQKITRIQFYGNQLQLSESTFRNFSNLDWLFLSRNNITVLPVMLIHDLKELTKFSLDQNEISVIPNNFFINSKLLLNLDLSRNNIRFLGDNFSLGLIRVITIDLSHNQIESITENTFASLINVQIIRMSHNRLKTINDMSFYWLAELRELDLSGNVLQINTFPQFATTSLKLLNLSNNSISDFHDCFPNCVQQYFVDLDLSGNNISHLDIEQFKCVINSEKSSAIVRTYNNKIGRPDNHAQVVLQNNPIKSLNLQWLKNNTMPIPTNFYINTSHLIDCHTVKLFCKHVKTQNSSNTGVVFVSQGQNVCEQVGSIDCKEDRQCPKNCTCLFIDYNDIDCFGGNLTTIPNIDNFGISSVQRLKMDDNVLSDLSEFYLNSRWENLTHLRLNHCNVSSEMLLDISSGKSIFEKVDKLEKLSMTYNLIQVLPNDFINNLPKLWFLDLSYNLIEEIPINFFEANKQLRILSLAHNKLKTINHFKSLINLQYLNLKFNDIQEVLPNILSELENLTALDLTSNNITQITAINWPRKLKLLSLKDNQINNFDKFYFPPTLKRLYLSGNKISILEFQYLFLPNELLLDLRHNIIQEISLDSSTHLKKEYVYFVYVRGNPIICDCNSQSFIDHYTNRKKETGVEFPEPLLQCRQEKLTLVILVDLSDKCNCPRNCSCSPDQLMCTKAPTIVTNITSILTNKKLVLTNFDLSTIWLLNSSTWVNLTFLEIRSAANGTSSEFQSFGLGEKKMLRGFSVTDSNINNLPERLLHNATNLLTLDLSRNKVTSISDNFFEASVNIETLILSDNKLNFISGTIFSKLLVLKILNLEHNEIKMISKDLFQNCKQLREINLNNNQIINIDGESFTHPLDTLTTINLSHNLLGKEEFSKLKLPSTLTKLNLAFNQISQFTPNNPQHLNHLEELDISNNLITEINIEHILQYPNSIAINFENNNISDIEYNPREITNTSRALPSIKLNRSINCNCKIKWIIDSLNSVNKHLSPVKVIGQDLTCDSPDKLKGSLVRTSDESTLKCSLVDDCPSNCNCYKENSLNNINCSYKNLPNVPDNTMPNVDVLRLDGNVNISLRNLKSNKWENLKYLYVSYCQNFGMVIFDDLLSANLNLEVIWMMNDGITKIPSELFNNLNNLTELNLSSNKLKELPLDFFVPLRNLQKFNVSHSRLLFFNNDLSSDLPYIQHIDASFNGLLTFKAIFASSVISFNLSHNDIHSFSSNVDISLLNLSYNNLTTYNITNCRGCNVYLNDNSLQEIIFPNASSQEIATVHVFNNPIACYCLVKESHHINANIKLITDQNCSNQLSTKLGCYFPNNVCHVSTQCDSCTCVKNINLQNVTMHCSDSNLTTLPTTVPSNVTRLTLKYNIIPTLQGLDDKNWINLQFLDINHNEIHTITDEILPSDLKEISLAYNKLITPSGWLEKFVTGSIPNIKKLYLGNNPWECECKNEPFQKWLIRYGKQIVSDFNNIKCDGTDDEIVNVILCFEIWTVIGPVLSCVLILSIVSIVFLSFYCSNKQAVHVYLYGHCFCCKWCISRDEIDKDKLYDAFISYSSEDTEFVVQHLIPELEEKSPNYKLCIHERDWNIGEQILDQIEASVTSSKRVIVLLSNNFMQSMWSSLEFKTAHYYSIKDKVNRIIVIVLGDLPPKETLDADVRMYINLNTYLKWGDPRFWNKLRYAMPRKAVAKKEVA